MAKLYVERRSERDIKMRNLFLTLDDQPEVSLQFGESLELPLEPGKHRLRATNRIYKAEARFTASEGETVRFEGVNEPKGGLLNTLALISGTVLYRPLLRRL